MQVKSNTLLKMAVPACLFIAIAIGVKSCGSRSQPAATQTGDSVVADLTQEELKALGVEPLISLRLYLLLRKAGLVIQVRRSYIL